MSLASKCLHRNASLYLANPLSPPNLPPLSRENPDLSPCQSGGPAGAATHERRQRRRTRRDSGDGWRKRHKLEASEKGHRRRSKTFAPSRVLAGRAGHSLNAYAANGLRLGEGRGDYGRPASLIFPCIADAIDKLICCRLSVWKLPQTCRVKVYRLRIFKMMFHWLSFAVAVFKPRVWSSAMGQSTGLLLSVCRLRSPRASRAKPCCRRFSAADQTLKSGKDWMTLSVTG